MGRLRQQVAGTAEQPVDDEEAEHEEGDELDQRLDGNRQHQPVLMLGRVDMAGAEGAGETSEHDRDEEGQVAQYRHVRRRRMAAGRSQEDRERVGDGLQLQRDIGQGADHRDEADQRRDALALAIARADEIGDRGDVLRFGDGDDAADEAVAQPDDEDRPNIDAEEVEARAIGEAD